MPEEREWTIEFYLDENGRSPVLDFLRSLDRKTKARFEWSIEELQRLNVQAREPLVKHLAQRRRIMNSHGSPPQSEGQDQTPEAQAYQQWRAELRQDPEYRAVYEEEAARSALWLQLVEARKAAGLTQKQVAERLGMSQAQVSRMAQEGYDAYPLNTLRRYIQALGGEYTLEVIVRRRPDSEHAPLTAPETSPRRVLKAPG